MSLEPGGVDSDSDAVCGVNESDIENETQDVDVETENDFSEKRVVDCSGKLKSKLENLGGVVLARSGSGNENLKLSDSDLVWGKVKSYPWWPGQVFSDASVASRKSMKYFKKGNFLIAYFGDFSFAWNDVSSIKPFHEHFSQMVNQSNSPDFLNAVDCALEEVSRRAEFGLSCACVSEEAYNRLKTQTITNPGIREGSSVRYGGDKLSSAVFFEPAKLVEYMKDLACVPRYDETDKLQFVTNRAQLLAFQRWTSYLNFPGYETFLRSVDSAGPLASLPEPNADEQVSSKKRKTEEKTLSDFIANKRFGSCRSIGKSDGKLHSDKKRKAESSESGKPEKKIKNNRRQVGSASRNSDKEFNSSVGKKMQKVVAKPCFGMVAVPLRTESEMSSFTPTLKPCSDSNSTSKVEAENKKTKKPQLEEVAQKKTSSPDEMLSSLHSAKTRKEIPTSLSLEHSNYEDFENFIKETSCNNLVHDSKKESNTETSETWNVKDSSEEQTLPDEMPSSLHNAKTEKEIPDSISIDPSNHEDFEKFVVGLSCSNDIDDSKKATSTETSEPKDVKDCSEEQITSDDVLSRLHSAKTLKEISDSISIDHSNYAEFDQFLKELPRSNLNDDSKKVSMTEISEPSDVKDSSDQQLLPVNKDITDSGTKKQTGLKDCPADSSEPNALILKFASAGSVPSEEKLNSIFNRYGPLRESETRVMKKGKRAKVVFKRGEDAKTAFSSSGKYGIFGPSLLSYSLKYVSPKAEQSNDITN